MHKLKIGFIGQGWVGKNLADHFEDRGFEVTRYALEEPYIKNKSKIKGCDITFIAVPTPSTPEGFDYSAIEEALALIGAGKIAVLRSTVLPGTTEKLQKLYPDIVVLHAPEFLREATARYDVDHPDRNIVGFIGKPSQEAARQVLEILPSAPVSQAVPAGVAELVKYAGNSFLVLKVIFANLVYELAQSQGADYEQVAKLWGADPRIGTSHLKISDKGGRGAGGHCFIKDLAAFAQAYHTLVPDDGTGRLLLDVLEAKNISLLMDSGKDLDLLKGVYGEEIFNGG